MKGLPAQATGEPCSICLRPVISTWGQPCIGSLVGTGLYRKSSLPGCTPSFSGPVAGVVLPPDLLFADCCSVVRCRRTSFLGKHFFSARRAPGPSVSWGDSATGPGAAQVLTDKWGKLPHPFLPFVLSFSLLVLISLKKKKNY